MDDEAAEPEIIAEMLTDIFLRMVRVLEEIGIMTANQPDLNLLKHLVEMARLEAATIAKRQSGRLPCRCGC